MDISRISAIALALLAAMLVIIAGKSCADDAISQKRRSSRPTAVQNTAATSPPDERTPQKATQPPVQEATEAAAGMYEEVTNMFGDVVETIPITDAAEDMTEEITETKSILEEYDEIHNGTTPPEQEDEAPVTTTTYIEPATNIVIHVG